MAEQLDQAQVLKKVSDLVHLAQDGDSEESRTAAHTAALMMKEHRLVVLPMSEIERVRLVIGDAQSQAQKHEAAGTQKLVIGAIVGALLGRKLF